ATPSRPRGGAGANDQPQVQRRELFMQGQASIQTKRPSGRITHRSAGRGRAGSRRTAITAAPWGAWLRLGWVVGVALLCWAGPASAQSSKEPVDETQLGQLVIVGTEGDTRPHLAILPSLSPDLED